MSSLTNKDFIFNEMMTHVPLNTHIEPQTVLVIGIADDELKQEIAKYHIENLSYIENFDIDDIEKSSIDVVLLIDDIELDSRKILSINNILKDDGLIAFRSKSFDKNKDKLIKDLRLVGKYFWIAMPFRFGHTFAILASKKYHPQADIILQRSDLLDNLKYYTSEIHNCSFVMPRYINEALLGIAKR
jgi:spermidine synthase